MHRRALSILRSPRLQIVRYPHPTLRHVSKSLRRVDAELHRIVREMFELMYAEKGIGLAANQVDLPYRLFVLNLESDAARPELEQVFINPVIRRTKGKVEAEEGCLSLPGLYGQVSRAEFVEVMAYDLTGEEVRKRAEGLFARAVQHEIDHLDGVLFIDKLEPSGQTAARPALEEFERAFADARQRGEIPDDAALAARLAELERERT
jgi:peptide deformylase